MVVSTLWMVSFAALWALLAIVAVAQGLVIRHALRVEEELLEVNDGPEVGTEVNSVVLPDLEGTMRSLAPAGGKRGALFFMSPACPACSQVSRVLRALPELPELDVAIICQAPAEGARRWAERRELFYPVLPDPEGIAMRALQVSGIPFVLVVDAAGRVERKGVAGNYRDMLELLGAPAEEPVAASRSPELALAPGGN
jgi:peroxiredoxin